MSKILEQLNNINTSNKSNLARIDEKIDLIGKILNTYRIAWALVPESVQQTVKKKLPPKMVSIMQDDQNLIR